MNELVSEIRKRYLEVFSNHLSSTEVTDFYTADFVMFGLMDRNIGLVEAMPALIKDHNIHAFAPLLRVQLDGLLRLHAFRLVKNTDELAEFIIKGNELRKFKDKNNKALTDRYLVNSLKKELPWLESVYNELCGWVHFSNTHLSTAATEGKEERSIYIGIGKFRTRVEPQVIEESVELVKVIHEATSGLIEAYFSLPKHA